MMTCDCATFFSISFFLLGLYCQTVPRVSSYPVSCVACRSIIPNGMSFFLVYSVQGSASTSYNIMIPTTMTIIFSYTNLGKSLRPAKARLARKPDSERVRCCAAVCGARGPATSTCCPASSGSFVALGRTASASQKLFNTLVRPATYYYL
jgi:hypothetical protein